MIDERPIASLEQGESRMGVTIPVKHVETETVNDRISKIVQGASCERLRQDSKVLDYIGCNK
jgi:hypothetical protein